MKKQSVEKKRGINKVFTLAPWMYFPTYGWRQIKMSGFPNKVTANIFADFLLKTSPPITVPLPKKMSRLGSKKK